MAPAAAAAAVTSSSTAALLTLPNDTPANCCNCILFNTYRSAGK
jgi:hypothetical protein